MSKGNLSFAMRYQSSGILAEPYGLMARWGSIRGESILSRKDHSKEDLSVTSHLHIYKDVKEEALVISNYIIPRGG